jgi:hypothetical protein
VVVVMVDSTCEFHVSLVFVTTVDNGVSVGISSWRFWQAFPFEIHDTPTLEDTMLSEKVKRPPTYVLELFDLAEPLFCTVLPPVDGPA